MTRINAGIPPQLLTNKHLLAEHREIKRIPNMVAKHGYDPKSIPAEFCLGKGHVKFFYDKQSYLLTRYLDIQDECVRRGFKVTDYCEAWQNLPCDCFGDGRWNPDGKVRTIISERINERLGLDKNQGVKDWHSLIDKPKKQNI